MNKKLILAVFATPAILALSSPQTTAQVTTIYEDDFSGTPGTTLRGTLPDIRPAAETWQFNQATSVDSYKADGVVEATAVGAGNGHVSALLPFAPVAGKIYRLSATMASTASSSWMGFGFADKLTTTTGTSGLFAFSSLQGVSWILAAGPGSSGNQYFAGPQNTNLVDNTFTSGAQDYEIVLDTSGSQWKTSFYRGGVQRGTTFTYLVNPTILGAGFTKNDGAGGSIDNFKLTSQNVVITPEPPWVTIYEDDFSGAAATSLSGAPPDVRPGTETWSFQNSTALVGFEANGAAVVTGGDALGQVAALLPFAPQPNKRYRLTGTINCTVDDSPSNNQWMTFGFTDSLTTADGLSGLFAFSPLNGVGWILQGSPDSASSSAFAGPDISNPVFSGFSNGALTWVITLDTSAELWTLSFVRGGVQAGATYTYTSNPTILGVGFSKGQDVAGTVDNFKLEVQNLAPVLTGFELWASENDIAGESFTDDFDKDGTSNGMEYALGMNPAVPDVITPPVVTVAGNILTVSYPKGAEAAADDKISYAIEVSSDLGIADPWQAVVPMFEDIIEITHEIPISGPREFARLKVVRIP